MNETIHSLQSHRSIRKFTTDPVTDEQLSAILQSAQMASTSSNMQAYSVIGVTEPSLKKQLSVLAGNQIYIEQCPLLLVWCADLSRIGKASSRHHVHQVPSTVENFIIATVDTALAAQNAAVAAESLGLGIVYIGGIRNNPRGVSDLLHLPKQVYPVCGMCVGVPDQTPIVRPRLPLQAVYHTNRYDADKQDEYIDQYDESIRKYMLMRTGGKRETVWSKEMADKMKQPQREHMRTFLQQQGFELI